MNIEHINDKIFSAPSICKADPRGLGVLFFERMKKYKDNISQIDAETEETLTHGEILLRSVRVAQHLQALNITTDDIIVLCLPNSMDSVLPLFAGLFLNTKIASIDPSMPKSDVKYLLNMVKPKFIFSDAEVVNMIETILKEDNLKSKIIVNGETKHHIPFSEVVKSTGKENEFIPKPVKDVMDTAIIFFSSGTTGYPKGVCAPHYSLQVNQEYFLQAIDPSVVLYYSTFYWSTAFLLLTVSILAGSTRVIVKNFDENTVLHTIEKYKVSLNFMAPVYSYKLTKKYKSSNFDSSNFKNLFLGGSKVTIEQLEAIRKFFSHTMVSNCYGMSEACGCLTIFHQHRDKNIIEKKNNSVGRPMPELTYKFVNVNTEEVCGKNQIGELRIKGKALMTGYFNNPEATANAYDEDGFLKTGDIGYYDEDYCIYIIDRIKELIKFQNWQISPTEIDDIILTNPDVKEVVVFGIPHDEDSEHLTACIVLKDGASITKEDLMNYYNEQICDYDRKKLRGGIYLVDKILRTPSGKPQRLKMKDLFLNGHIK